MTKLLNAGILLQMSNYIYIIKGDRYFEDCTLLNSIWTITWIIQTDAHTYNKASMCNITHLHQPDYRNRFSIFPFHVSLKYKNDWWSQIRYINVAVYKCLSSLNFLLILLKWIIEIIAALYIVYHTNQVLIESTTLSYNDIPLTEFMRER